MHTTTDTAAPAGGHIIINGRKAVHIPLETAIERKGETITAVHLMKPLAGDLRGLLLAELLQYKTDAVMKLLPRITVGVNALSLPQRPGSVLARAMTQEMRKALRELLATRGAATFGELVADCTATLQVVARFLGLLQLYRESAVAFDQPLPLGELTVRWMAPDVGRAESSGADVEEYE